VSTLDQLFESIHREEIRQNAGVMGYLESFIEKKRSDQIMHLPYLNLIPVFMTAKKMFHKNQLNQILMIAVNPDDYLVKVPLVKKQLKSQKGKEL
jgi:hypothetical protein